VANGLHDAEFVNLAQKIAAAQPDAIIRTGWEMNLASTLWTAVGNVTAYIGAYRRVVGIFRAQSSLFKFDWCPNLGTQNLAPDQAYPGDDVVDYIGLDVYDFTGGSSVEERWADIYLNGAFGLNWQKSFAAAHGKLMSYPEWGVGEAGDNPYFVQQMYNWFVANAPQIAYACYFNVDGAWPTEIDNNQFPQSQALFETLFTRA
jgi:beta-mannanase